MAEREAVLKDLEGRGREAGEHIAALERQAAGAREELNRIIDQLWRMHMEDKAVRAQGLPEWEASDRKYVWTARLYEILGAQFETLRKTRDETVAAEERRGELLQSAAKQLAEVNEAKDALLKDRLTFQKRLEEVRQEKLDREERLDRILAMVDKLDYTLSEALKGRGVPFEERKGLLPWPVEGETAVRFAPGASPPVRGLGLAVADRAEVRAVSSGKVVHDDILRGFGRVIILLHGDAYYSLYAFLSESRVRMGEEVEQGALLGKAGYYPPLQGPGLYFELRFHQKAINPETWLASR